MIDYCDESTMIVVASSRPNSRPLDHCHALVPYQPTI